MAACNRRPCDSSILLPQLPCRVIDVHWPDGLAVSSREINQFALGAGRNGGTIPFQQVGYDQPGRFAGPGWADDEDAGFRQRDQRATPVSARAEKRRRVPDGRAAPADRFRVPSGLSGRRGQLAGANRLRLPRVMTAHPANLTPTLAAHSCDQHHREARPEPPRDHRRPGRYQHPPLQGSVGRTQCGERFHPGR